MAPETQEVDSTYVSLQREMAVMPDLGFEQDIPGVDEVNLQENVKEGLNCCLIMKLLY